jgi:hypothetical protein
MARAVVIDVEGRILAIRIKKLTLIIVCSRSWNGLASRVAVEAGTSLGSTHGPVLNQGSARCSLVTRFLPASGTMAEPLGGFATLARRASR